MTGPFHFLSRSAWELADPRARRADRALAGVTWNAAVNCPASGGRGDDRLYL